MDERDAFHAQFFPIDERKWRLVVKDHRGEVTEIFEGSPVQILGQSVHLLQSKLAD